MPSPGKVKLALNLISKSASNTSTKLNKSLKKSNTIIIIRVTFIRGITLSIIEVLLSIRALFEQKVEQNFESNFTIYNLKA